MAIKNLASGTLAESVSASATTLLVYVGNGSASTIKGVWPTPPFYATIMPSSPTAGVPNSLDSEIVKVTAVGNDQVGNTALTVVRGQKGSTTQAFAEGAIVTNADYVEEAVLLGDEGTAETPTPWIGTDDVENGAITRDKLDNATSVKMVLLDTIDAANIPYKTAGKGLGVDIRKYFANNSTAANRPMVFDELRLKFDIGLSEVSNIHYLRFGINDGASNMTVRNMLSFDADNTVSCNHSEHTNAIIGMRLGSNTEVRIFPYGGTGRIPTLADDLTLITFCDNSSVNFTSEGTRINFNTLYRMQYSDNKIYLYQNDVSGTLFNGTIKVYGIKYPTA